MVELLLDSDENSRLTLEVFHDVQKAVVYVRMVTELYFHLIEIAQGVL